MRWGLTDEQIKARASGIGGSDAWTVVHGTAEERYDLWREKIGEKKPRKIMSDWQAAWRHVTETLQLDWYEHIHPDHRVIDRGASVFHPKHKFMRCTLDGRIVPLGVPINAKHVSRWTKEAREWAIEHYTCSTTHEAYVCGADYGYLSLLHDEKEPEILKIDTDPFYLAEMIEREEEFWQACVDRVPPADCAALDVPKTVEPVKRLRNIDLSAEFGSPQWEKLIGEYNWAVDFANAAEKFRETDGAAKVHAMAREEMKALAPEDAGEIRRGDVLLKRNKAGAVTIAREAK